MTNIEKKVITLIEGEGPLTGAELISYTNADPLLLLRTCRLSNNLSTQTVGTRYLRFDRRIEGFARLSPSILREFLTYSIIGLSSDQISLEIKVHKISSHIEDVSRAKSDLAYNVVSALAGRLGNDSLENRACFIIAGDIVFNMAHDVPRPERSTGKMVKGSDIDLVVIVNDQSPVKLMQRLDEEVYREKQDLLLNPYIKEEIDYVIKDLARVREQVKFDTFKHMVACKILQEGTLLFGSEEIFHNVKVMLRDYGVIEKILTMEARAKAFRKSAEEYIIHEDPKRIESENLYLFYPTEESEEFE